MAGLLSLLVHAVRVSAAAPQSIPLAHVRSAAAQKCKQQILATTALNQADCAIQPVLQADGMTCHTKPIAHTHSTDKLCSRHVQTRMQSQRDQHQQPALPDYQSVLCSCLSCSSLLRMLSRIPCCSSTHQVVQAQHISDVQQQTTCPGVQAACSRCATMLWCGLASSRYSKPAQIEQQPHYLDTSSLQHGLQLVLNHLRRKE